MSLLAVKLLVTPAVVVAASLVGRRWGAAIGGWLVGLAADLRAGGGVPRCRTRA